MGGSFWSLGLVRDSFLVVFLVFLFRHLRFSFSSFRLSFLTYCSCSAFYLLFSFSPFFIFSYRLFPFSCRFFCFSYLSSCFYCFFPWLLLSSLPSVCPPVPFVALLSISLVSLLASVVSSFIFNTKGYTLNEAGIGKRQMSYVDDYTAIASSPEGAQLILDAVDNYLSWTECMRAKPLKCRALAFKVFRKGVQDNFTRVRQNIQHLTLSCQYLDRVSLS